MDPDLDNGTGSMDPDLDNGTGSMDPDLGNAIDQEDAPPLDTTAIGDVLENLNKPITASGGKFPNAQVVEPATPKTPVSKAKTPKSNVKTPVSKATTPMSKAISQSQVSKVSRKSSRNKSKFNTSTMSKSFCMKGMERKLSARARGVKESGRIAGKDDRGAAYRSVPTKGRVLDTDRS
jgi:hypothetical protein